MGHPLFFFRWKNDTPGLKETTGWQWTQNQAAVLESAAMIQGRQKSSKAVHSSSPFGDLVPKSWRFVLSFQWFPFKAGYQTLGFLRGVRFLGGGWLAIQKKHTPFFFLPLKNHHPRIFRWRRFKMTLIFTQISTQILEKKGTVPLLAAIMLYIYIYYSIPRLPNTCSGWEGVWMSWV